MDDLISRAVLNDYIEKEYDGVCVYDVSGTEVIRDFQNIVDIQPAVDAVPVVHAKWVEETDRSYHWHCSKCKMVWGVTKYFMKYCPNCGALMDGDT